MRRLLLVAVGLHLLATHAIAQQRLFALREHPPSGTEVWEVRIDNGIVSEPRLRTVAPWVGAGPSVAGGGRFLLWSALVSMSVPRATWAFDRISGWSDDLRIGSPFVSSTPWVPDPSRERIFTGGAGAIVSLSASGLISIPGTSGFALSAVSTDGTRLYATRVAEAGPPEIRELVALDSERGTTLSAPIPVADYRGVVAARDHASVWVLAARPSEPGVPRLFRFDLSSGAELFATTLAATSFPHLVGVDEQRDRVFVQSWLSGNAILDTYDSATGAPIASEPFNGNATAALDAGAGQVLVLSLVADHATLHTLSSTTGQLTSSAALGNTGLVHVAFGVPPLPPSLDAPVISSGRSVTLSWTPSPELTTQFTVEAGSGPGLANLATLTVPDGTTLTVPGVPPGTYYVRVKAANYIGDSVPSNEIVVTVQ